MRIKNPKKWTFRALGVYFGIDRKTAYDIFVREESRSKTKKLSTDSDI